MYRRGQWVKTTRDLQIKAVAAGQPVTITIPAPSVGIHAKPLAGREYHRELEPPVRLDADGVAIAESSHLCEVAFVDAETGMTTILEALVPYEALTAVTERGDIPAERIKHLPHDWQPRP